MTKTYKHWTKEDDALLRELRADKYSVEQIADHMGRTKSSITNRTHLLGLPVRKRGPQPKPKPEVRVISRPRSRMDKLMSMLMGRK